MTNEERVEAYWQDQREQADKPGWCLTKRGAARALPEEVLPWLVDCQKAGRPNVHLELSCARPLSFMHVFNMFIILAGDHVLWEVTEQELLACAPLVPQTDRWLWYMTPDDTHYTHALGVVAASHNWSRAAPA